MSIGTNCLFACALLGITGCGGGGATQDAAPPDAVSVDAVTQDSAPGPCDPNADAGSSANTGFVAPTDVTKAYVGDTLMGDADWSCLGTKTTDVATSAAVALSGTALDLQSGDALVGAEVAFWATADSSGTPAATATTDANGDYSLTLAPGALRPTARVSAQGALDSYTLNIGLEQGQSTQTLDLASVSALTANALPAFIGVVRTGGKAMVIGKIVDCQGRAVANAIAAFSSTSAASTTCATHVPGVTSYYFSAGSTSLPVRHSQRLSTNSDGLFLLLDAPPADLSYVQVWGFTAGDDPLTDQPRLLGELPVQLYGDTVWQATVEPLRIP